MLKETPRAKGGQPYQEKPTGIQLVPVEKTLAEMGLDKKTSKLVNFPKANNKKPALLRAGFGFRYMYQ